MDQIGVDTPTVAENDETREIEYSSFAQLNDMKVPFPNLEPGRALVNLETNEMVEMFHSVIGNWKTSGGTLSHLEERRLNEEVGLDWGGIIQEKYVAHRITECPASNQHGEVPVPEDRPEKSEIVERSPEEFADNVLKMDKKVPFMLLERPSVDYAEVGTGETYEVIGSYWPHVNDPENRVRDPEAISEEFELEIAVGRTEVDTHPLVEVPKFNILLSWDDVTEESVIQFTKTDDRVEASVDEDGEKATIHLFHHHTDGYKTDRVHIESPYSAKEDIMDLSWEQAHPDWDAEFGERGAWRFDATAFGHAIEHFIECGYGVTVTPDVITTLGIESAEYTSHVEDAEEIAIEREQQAQEDFDASVETIVNDWDTDGNVSIQAASIKNPTLLALDITLGAGGQMTLENGITVSGGLKSIDAVPESVADSWQPSAGDNDEETYEWYNPSSGARVSVEEVESKWGLEYAITVEHQYSAPETVATLAGEKHVVETVVTHLKAMT